MYNGLRVEVPLAPATFRVYRRQILPWDYFLFARQPGMIA